MNRILFFLLIITLTSCQSETIEETGVKIAEGAVGKMEQAHQKTAFWEKAAIQFDLKLIFGGREAFNGNMMLWTDSSRGIVTRADSNQVYFVKDQVYHAPDHPNPKGARSTAYTFSYFFMLPYKLSDAGTVWTAMGDKKSEGKMYATQRLSFETGTGDAPDDWYLIYPEADGLITVAAYIVTGGGSSQEEAEKSPHAIKYEGYESLDGIPIARKWSFWNWNEAEGITEKIGEAELTNVRFLTKGESKVDVPEAWK